MPREGGVGLASLAEALAGRVREGGALEGGASLAGGALVGGASLAGGARLGGAGREATAGLATTSTPLLPEVVEEFFLLATISDTGGVCFLRAKGTSSGVAVVREALVDA